ncbi:hypothetical protein C3486_12190 [Streptomyces sp. Ru73]|uniref:hypothetical protein n=1 Tax=Streptomyces sp. Ru73 TaxID=2080748 RepID=UPI000CDDC161|nr:hypothetical protein [Streptomyces sp. Ru73]POX40748.1 hypothetical protein C3486_12190 [Streptomyces sp. Ru73]
MSPPRFTVCTCTVFTACVVLAGSAQPAGRQEARPGPAAATAGVAARPVLPAAPVAAAHVPTAAEHRSQGGMNSGRSAGLVVAGGVALVVIGRIVHVLRKRGGGDAE